MMTKAEKHARATERAGMMTEAEKHAWATERAEKRAEELTYEERLTATFLAVKELAMALDSAALIMGSDADGAAVLAFTKSWDRYRLSPDDSQEMVDAWCDTMEAAKSLMESPTLQIISRPNAKTPGTTPKG